MKHRSTETSSSCSSSRPWSSVSVFYIYPARQEDPPRSRPAGRPRDRLQGQAAERHQVPRRPDRPDHRHHQPPRQRPGRHRVAVQTQGSRPDLRGAAGRQERRPGRAHHRQDRPAPVLQRRPAARGRPVASLAAAIKSAGARPAQAAGRQPRPSSTKLAKGRAPRPSTLLGASPPKALSATTRAPLYFIYTLPPAMTGSASPRRRQLTTRRHAHTC